MSASVLIIGPAGRLRDGLHIILCTFPGIGEIFVADDFTLAHEVVVRNRPATVIVDADTPLGEDCVLLKQLLSRHKRARYLVIANTMYEANQARQVGADKVLLRGFSTNTLYQALVFLNVLPKSGFVSKPARLSRKLGTAVPLAQTN